MMHTGEGAHRRASAAWTVTTHRIIVLSLSPIPRLPDPMGSLGQQPRMVPRGLARQRRPPPPPARRCWMKPAHCNWTARDDATSVAAPLDQDYDLGPARRCADGWGRFCLHRSMGGSGASTKLNGAEI